MTSSSAQTKLDCVDVSRGHEVARFVFDWRWLAKSETGTKSVIFASKKLNQMTACWYYEGEECQFFTPIIYMTEFLSITSQMIFGVLSSNGHVWIDIWLITLFTLHFATSNLLKSMIFHMRKKQQVLYTYQASPFLRGTLTKFPISFFCDSRSGGPPSAIFIHYRKSRILLPGLLRNSCFYWCSGELSQPQRLAEATWPVGSILW